MLCSRRDIYIVNTKLVNFHKVYHVYVYATGLIGGHEVCNKVIGNGIQHYSQYCIDRRHGFKEL